jgi:CheY-like chemotaxis protein
MTERPKILLVDDEALVRDELGGLLEDEGYEVVAGADGREGLELFQQHQPDMVITDVRMPRGDGLSLAVAIRELSPETPVSVITGHGTEQMVIYALRAGVTDFIKKPVKLEDLTAALLRMENARHPVHREAADLPSAAELLEYSWSYRLDNDLAAVTPFVEAVLSACARGMAPARLMELSLALRELVLNAIEHGNLGLSYEEKAHALESGSLERVLARRSNLAPYANRQTRLTARRTDTAVSIEIQDEGEGFDWQSLPDPTDTPHLLKLHGRGILLARMSVDRLTYSERGNRVTIVKALRGAPTPGPIPTDPTGRV